MLAGSCHGVLKIDVPLVFGCHKPIAEQRVVVSNNLGRSEQLPIPGAMRITDQGDIILQATSLPTRCIDAEFGLNACNDEVLDAMSAQEVMQVGFVKRIRHLLLYDCIPLLWRDGGMNLPALCSIFERMALAFASVLDIYDGDVGLTYFRQQVAYSGEQFVSPVDRVGGMEHANLHVNHYNGYIYTHANFLQSYAYCLAHEQQRNFVEDITELILPGSHSLLYTEMRYISSLFLQF